MAAQLKHIKSIAALTDEELLTAFKENADQEMLAQLYVRYTDLVYGVCMKYLKDAEACKRCGDEYLPGAFNKIAN